MGCLFSHGPKEEANPRSFKVVNVDDNGDERNPGRIEITEVDLIWYQRGKEPIRWPLKSLRRYGFDAELFSFESGRRCPTGPGIYAFKCRRAEALFNLLQESIQRQEETGATTNLAQMPITTINHRDNIETINGGPRNSRSRPPSIEFVSNSVPSRTNASSAPVYINDKVCRSEYMNTDISGATLAADPSSIDPLSAPEAEEELRYRYAELDLQQSEDDDASPTHLSNGHGPNSGDGAVMILPPSQQAMYVNIPPGPSEIKAKPTCIPERSCILNQQLPKRNENGNSAATSCGSGVQYIQLDLKSSSDSMTNGITVQPQASATGGVSNPESPTRKTESDLYAKIDIPKTMALNTSLKNVEDEGSRKTRHNSNIEELSEGLHR